ncbi:MAG: RecQ family ATP-dependent DNA helicase [Gammaproteobacteria bacterium]|nr:RecQ family ATP-dependent DNA helicase [Gammaproteobacteria bacterium]
MSRGSLKVSPNKGNGNGQCHVSTLPPCLSIDLEVDKHKRIHAIGAVRSDNEKSFKFSGRKLGTALEELDAFAGGTEFVLGHNLISFDLPILKANKPDLRILERPVVDTLLLSPLAFPTNPYHSLVKHYQDGGLRRRQVNDPELDSRLALDVFGDELVSLSKAPPDLLAAWHRLCISQDKGKDQVLDQMFCKLRGQQRPSKAESGMAIWRRLECSACINVIRELIAEPDKYGWSLAYALAWIWVAGGNSVMPSWVRHQFPQTGQIVSRLRDTACVARDCAWCRKHHDATKELNNWFGFDAFRPEPKDARGKPLQQSIVEKTMAREHVMGILPTGTGKSLCYQIPALSRYNKTGALTIVISPLVALMADQITGLESHGIHCCATINGLLSSPERADALDRLRMGDIGILLISPEQLRSVTIRRALDQREIGSWVLDEAHCLSRWGHDFRPDYRYVSRFIGEQAKGGPVPTVLCLTATAKPDVVEDICRHFRERLGIELTVFDGGSERTNLIFEVVQTTADQKFSDLQQVLEVYLPDDVPGGAIVYCATRSHTELVANFLKQKGFLADFFHAKLLPETKKEVQRQFIDGDLRIIAATNAFGMGIDKPDVRLVIHADIPGSLENYLQEAGRAGRDREPARCVLLYVADDVERQFGMSAASQLTREQIHSILRALRKLDRNKRYQGDVVATAGEILLGADQPSEIDTATDDTRVRTAVAWLEESQLLTREENVVSVFPSSLRVASIAEAKARLEANNKLAVGYRDQLMQIAEALMNASPDEGISTDELMVITRLDPQGVRAALFDLERLGIASNDMALTAFVHTGAGISHPSRQRLEETVAVETALISHMREAAPDLGKGDRSPLNLRIAAQKLKDEGLIDPLPERLYRILSSLANDGRGEDYGSGGSLQVRKQDRETAWITLQREWSALEETATLRREAAGLLLEHFLECLPAGSRGTDQLAETTLGKLMQVIESDLELKSRIRHPEKLLERSLLWLHEQEVLRLNKGLTVFRTAMTIRMEQQKNRGFTKADFSPLEIHYKGRTLQIHVMMEFAEKGLAAITDAMRLVRDYFELPEEDFLEKWMPGRDKEIGRQTTPASWYKIVESLNDAEQQLIVADQRVRQSDLLVLAGPGSGKTRVLVHRIAWLIRVARAAPRSILALAYNRHAAVEIRHRLNDLIGRDARGVTVLTCHGLAMRLAGESFAGRTEQLEEQSFRDVINRAVAILEGKELLPEDADDRRQRLLEGYRWILVDEYQDIGPEQYELISAVAGRTRSDTSEKLTLFAVGDDDQNIYSFIGASVEFIRRFEADYGARQVHLLANYRSTAHIVAVANALIEPAKNRMKAGYPIRINRARARDPAGGSWSSLDPVSQGKVQILPVGNDYISQASVILTELLRLSELVEKWDWSRCAVIAREWKTLVPVRTLCESHAMAQQIRVQMANEDINYFWHLRQTRALIRWLNCQQLQFVNTKVLRDWVETCPTDRWQELMAQAINEYALESDDSDIPVLNFIEWMAEWCRDFRRRQRGLLLLTAHRAKGLEFDHVVVLDGDWNRLGADEDFDAQRRLYYVAMTRAQHTLTLAQLKKSRSFQSELLEHSSIYIRQSMEHLPTSNAVYYKHVQPTLKDVDLGFVGRYRSTHPAHGIIKALSVDDKLEVQVDEQGRWLLLDSQSRQVGRLAKSFKPPKQMRCRSATVFAIVSWSRDSTDPQWHNNLKCDVWEVVVPSLIFEPER